MLPYLVTPALRQRLDLVRHLLAFGRQLVVVSGAPGSGRTRMLGQLAGEADGDADLDVITLHGPGCVSRAALLTRLHETLAATADAAAPEGAALVEAIRAEVRQRRARARQPVILLDDADALAEEAITALLELAHRGEELDELRVVLAAREEGALLTRLEQASGHAARVHVVSVPPLDPARLVELGEAWCEERDLPEQVLPAAELAAIAATCAGNPGRFVAALGARLDAGAGSGRRWPRLVVSPALQRAAGIGVVVLAALGLVALALHERDGGDTPAPPVSRTIELELPAAGAPAPPSAEAPTATEPTDGVPGSVRRPREAPLPVMDAAMDVTPAPTPDGAPTAPLDAPADATPDAASDGSPGAMSDAVTAVAAPAATPPADDG
ncbi:MAG: AAA family ATPase, partial [Gammaproteobacteria bacterium]